MKRGVAGFVGGLIGGVIKIVADQVLYATGVSPVNTAGAFSRLFSGAWSFLTLSIFILYVLGAAVLGFIISLIFISKVTFNYFSSGIIVGVILWAIVNIIFYISGTVTPTWSIGSGGIISDLITYSILGISITYFIFKSSTEAVE